jgi:hypothetical protein
MNATRTFVSDPVRRTVAMGILSGALIAVYGLYLSREHITHVGYAMGLKPLEAETLFIFIDIVAAYGKMLTSKHLTAKTRRTGYKFLAFGGAASLVCNVASGVMNDSIGAAAYGAGIVALIAALEYGVANTKGKVSRTTKTADAPATSAAPAPKVTTKVCAAGCTCGKHNRTRKPRIPVSAPVSPGPMGPGPVGPSVAQLDELVGAAAYI